MNVLEPSAATRFLRPMNSNLYARLRENLPAYRDRPCFLLEDGSTISYGDLDAAVGRLASLLVARGVAPGDRGAVQAPKTPR